MKINKWILGILGLLLLSAVCFAATLKDTTVTGTLGVTGYIWAPRGNITNETSVNLRVTGTATIENLVGTNAIINTLYCGKVTGASEFVKVASFDAGVVINKVATIEQANIKGYIAYNFSSAETNSQRIFYQSFGKGIITSETFGVASLESRVWLNESATVDAGYLPWYMNRPSPVIIAPIRAESGTFGKIMIESKPGITNIAYKVPLNMAATLDAWTYWPNTIAKGGTAESLCNDGVYDSYTYLYIGSSSTTAGYWSGAWFTIDTGTNEAKRKICWKAQTVRSHWAGELFLQVSTNEAAWTNISSIESTFSATENREANIYYNSPFRYARIYWTGTAAGGDAWNGSFKCYELMIWK